MAWSHATLHYYGSQTYKTKTVADNTALNNQQVIEVKKQPQHQQEGQHRRTQLAAQQALKK